MYYTKEAHVKITTIMVLKFLQPHMTTVSDSLNANAASAILIFLTINMLQCTMLFIGLLLFYYPSIFCNICDTSSFTQIIKRLITSK